VEDATPPAIGFARDGDETTVRVRQALPSGTQVELLAWHSDAPAMNLKFSASDAAVIVSPQSEVRRDGAVRALAPRSARAGDVTAARRSEAAEQTVASTTLAERVALTPLPAVRALSDGRNEIVLRDVSSAVWIALRADLGADELRDL